MSKHPFKKGDYVYALITLSGYFTKGKVYKVHYAFVDNKEYVITIMTDQGILNVYLTFPFQKANILRYFM